MKKFVFKSNPYNKIIKGGGPHSQSNFKLQTKPKNEVGVLMQLSLCDKDHISMNKQRMEHFIIRNKKYG